MWAIASLTILTAAGFPIWRGLLALIVLQPIPGAPGKTPLGAARPVHYDKGSLRAGAREKESRAPRLTGELMISSGKACWPRRSLAKAGRLHCYSAKFVASWEDFCARESRELRRIKRGPPKCGTPNPTASVPPNLPNLGSCETAAPCVFIFAFIRVIRGLNFGCGGAAPGNSSCCSRHGCLYRTTGQRLPPWP
jgi:hypothetical protein